MAAAGGPPAASRCLNCTVVLNLSNVPFIDATAAEVCSTPEALHPILVSDAAFGMTHVDVL